MYERFWTEARRRLGDAAGTRALIEVLLAHCHLARRAFLSGIERALAVGSVDPEVVVVEARRAADDRSGVVVAIGVLSRFDRPVPTLDACDALLEESS